MTTTRKIKARPSANGNTRADFAAAYKSLTDAQKAMKVARAAVLENVANGRNYQHLGAAADDAIIDDRRRLFDDFDKVLTLLGLIGSDIADACDRHDREAA